MFYDESPQDGVLRVPCSSDAVVSVWQDGKVEGLKEVVVLSQQRRVSDKFLEVIKQRCLNVIHKKISYVLVVSYF